MRKNLFILATATIALASCTNDEFLGGDKPTLDKSNEISFNLTKAGMTKADHVGADAAALLNNKFIVAGFKGDKSTNGVATTKVFDHYIVEWGSNTAGTTTDNTSDWKYVGITAAAPATVTGTQTIKYWDYGTGQYDFIAFSTGTATAITSGDPTTGKVLISAVNASTAKTAAYTIKGATADLANCYIADLVTAYNPAETGKPAYGNEVQLKFRNLAAKVRVALYETIPGYSVKDVYFYTEGTSANAVISVAAQKSATLYAASNAIAADGTATVYFPTVGTGKISDSDYNKAHVTITAGTSGSTQAFGNLNYGLSEDTRLGTTDADKLYLAQTSSAATYAGTADPWYTTVLPNEAGTTLTLRVNYTLVSNDKSGETITVYGAKAIVPAIYAQWKSNYAYTYIFKISDNTNGKTGITAGPEGLYPITFDAVVTDAVEGTQSTITTVATPSITTYQKGHDVSKDEYSASATANTIYVMVEGKTDISTGKLYTVTGTNISEATVHDALTIGAGGSGVASRNGITLTDASIAYTATAIPGADGNNITVTEKSVGTFTPAAGTYAFVYETTTGTPSASELHTAVQLTADSAPSDFTTAYYKDEACTQQCVAGDYVKNNYYYQKITNTNKTYAIKIIKVVA